MGGGGTPSLHPSTPSLHPSTPSLPAYPLQQPCPCLALHPQCCANQGSSAGLQRDTATACHVQGGWRGRRAAGRRLPGPPAGLQLCPAPGGHGHRRSLPQRPERLRHPAAAWVWPRGGRRRGARQHRTPGCGHPGRLHAPLLQWQHPLPAGEAGQGQPSLPSLAAWLQLQCRFSAAVEQHDGRTLLCRLLGLSVLAGPCCQLVHAGGVDSCSRC